ncbi:lipoyl(octanoyl) transferase LipB [Chitinophaga sp. GCM10012297]|uniref:Octanoyltransferase n=1 Tax=Chitinophaga chungangae TaxID=2821488 RepID=A0ABS3Y8T7_9BACT|nr:lipoyl(octanoyl) transferase LipB [Chitinophaga chungangae]MBO9151097.1 lipoyl(octanoyl) transferase LipB [Chitinophaga chungangae]
MKQQIKVSDLGVIPYQDAWDLQERLLQESVALKADIRNGLAAPGASTQHHLLFCEHPPVYTLGKSGHMENLLVNDQALAQKGIGFVHTNRGGDITFHGEGQIVGYPIIDLEQFFTDIGRYLRFLEEVIIRTLADYGLKGERSKGETGVWLEPDVPGRARKICAMGVRCSRWVTMHGFAINVNTDLNYFSNIVACGIPDKAVTSLQKETGRVIPLEEVQARILCHFAQVFEAEMVMSGN